MILAKIFNSIKKQWFTYTNDEYKEAKKEVGEEDEKERGVKK